MKNSNPNWSKAELRIYILLLCANADAQESTDEIELIKSKTNPKLFDAIYKEFCEDSEEEALEKIDYNVQLHHFSNGELGDLKTEIRSVFDSDKKYTMMEANLDRVLDNIIY